MHHARCNKKCKLTTKRWQNWPSKGPKWSHWSVKMETPEAKQTAQKCFNMRNNMQNIAPQNANNWPQSAKIEATKCQKTVTAPCQSWKRNARQGNKETEKGTGIRRGNNGANKRPEKRTNLCPWWPCQSWKMKWRGEEQQQKKGTNKKIEKTRKKGRKNNLKLTDAKKKNTRQKQSRERWRKKSKKTSKRKHTVRGNRNRMAKGPKEEKTRGKGRRKKKRQRGKERKKQKKDTFLKEVWLHLFPSLILRSDEYSPSHCSLYISRSRPEGLNPIFAFHHF